MAMEIHSGSGYALAAQQGLRRQEQGIEMIAREADRQRALMQTVAEAGGVGGSAPARGQTLDITI